MYECIYHNLSRLGADLLLRHGRAGRERDAAVGHLCVYAGLDAHVRPDPRRGDTEGDVELRVEGGGPTQEVRTRVEAGHRVDGDGVMAQIVGEGLVHVDEYQDDDGDRPAPLPAAGAAWLPRLIRRRLKLNVGAGNLSGGHRRLLHAAVPIDRHRSIVAPRAYLLSNKPTSKSSDRVVAPRFSQQIRVQILSVW